MSITEKSWIPEKVAVIGAARSGLAAASYLREQGTSVFVSDSMPAEKLAEILTGAGLDGVGYEGGGNSSKVLESELIICSPGVPSDIAVIRSAHSLGIPVWAEIELAYRQSTAPWIALTGSTGKSTTVSLIGAAVDAAGVPGVVAGNIGLPLISVVADIPQNGIVIAEISSFQLENIEVFKPRVACVLNLMKNHLDRYESEDDYYNAKKLMMKNMGAGDTLVLNANDHRLRTWAEEFRLKLRVILFGASISGFECVWIENGDVVSSAGGVTRILFAVNEMNIAGYHNAENACAAAAVVGAIGLSDGAVRNGMISFSGLENRLEFVRELNGVGYYNDSKATTAESIECALKAFDNGVHLIAGGRDKGCDFAAIAETVRRKAKTVILLGEAADRIASEWQGLTEIIRVDSLEDAVFIGRVHAVAGDAVVLSPGCSSFDMYKSYEHRGEVFRAAVNGLK